MRRSPAVAAAFVLVAVLPLAACAGGSSGTVPTSSASPAARTPAVAPVSGSASVPATTSAPVATPTAGRTTSAPPANCPLPDSGFDCDLQRRIVAVDAYVAGRPGRVGYVVRDRQTGAVYRNADAQLPVWTASTIKLAMVVALYQWDDAGRIHLDAADRADVAAVLHSSDDDAADRLWFEYADSDGSHHQAYNAVFPGFGMTGLVPQHGFSNYFPYWGFQKCSADDLDALDQYLLTSVPADEQASIVSALQQVDPDQQWGVWGAGPNAAPGNKDGWSLEQGGWVMNSVGFVGPGQRYTLAFMNSLDGEGGYDAGRETDTHVAALLFAGRF